MSGDVQPRRRKDKKKKRDDDESSHGVHITKMGTEDVHLHVHQEHGTGGHWCAKLFFFSLLAILLGLIGLIILENRGLSDLDTPLSESRFSNYFDGWVEENRVEHEEHDAVQASIEEHDEHDEPFEEEEDQSEDHDDENATEEEEEDDHEDDDDEQNATAEAADDDEEENNMENVTEEEDEEEEEEENDDDDASDNVENEDENATVEDDNDKNVSAENDNATAEEENEEEDAEDEDDAENATEEETNTIEQSNENNNDGYEDTKNDNDNDVDNDGDDDDGDDDGDDDDDDNNTNENIKEAGSQQKPNNANSNDDDDDPFDEEDDDGTFESLENVVVDNDAEELLLLKEKARQQADEAAKNEPVSAEKDDDDDASAEAEKSSWASSQIKPKHTTKGSSDGAQANDDDDDFDMFEQELRRANEQMMRENYPAALKVFTLLSQNYPDKPQVFLGKAKSLDHIADHQRSNKLLQESLEAYKRYLSFGNTIKDNEEYRATAEHCIERMKFMGLHSQAVSIHEQLIERFNDEPNLRNQLAVTLLMSNRLSDAKLVLQETLRRWPLDEYAQVHYGFILKNHDKDYKNAVIYLQHGINSKAKGTQDGRFFFHLGDALQRLGREAEALKVYKSGVDLKLFPSVYQRSLYNEPHLRAQPFWTKDETTYAQFLNKLEQNWLVIRDEGLSVLSRRIYFQDEVENLRDFGDWKQFELYARGQRNQRNCQKAPISCGIVAHFHAASGCRRGQIKFSVLHPGTHVVPHCGPTNCRLRAHLGLVVPPTGTRLRVAQEQRTWTEGKFVIFDDSFEHEVWHNGSSLRLVLIVDFWHPDLSENQRHSLTPI